MLDNGEDGVVVREGIKTVADLRGIVVKVANLLNQQPNREFALDEEQAANESRADKARP